MSNFKIMLSKRHSNIYTLVFIYYLSLTLFVYHFGELFLVESIVFDLGRFIWGFVLSLPSIAIMNMGKDNKQVSLSSLFFAFQITLIYIPSIIFVVCQPSFSFLNNFFLLVCMYLMFVLVYFTTRIFGYSVNSKINDMFVKRIILILLFIYFSISLVTAALMFVRNGISFERVFDLDLIYIFRSEVFNSYKTSEFISLYGLAYFFLPLLILYSINSKNWFIFILTTLLNLGLFSLTGMKTYFLLPFLTTIIFYLMKGKSEYYFIKMIFIFILFLLVISFAISIYIESNYPPSLFLRSTFEAARLHVVWIDYFFDKDKIPFWVLNPSGHPNNPGLGWDQIIAEYLGGSTGNGEGANTGFFASSYSVYGVVGLLLHIILFSLILGYLNAKFFLEKNSWVPAACIPVMFLLTNISFVGAILYYGLGLTILATYSLDTLFSNRIKLH